MLSENIKSILNDTLNQHADLRSEVQGFTGLSNETPINIQNLFGPQFDRNFNPTLGLMLNQLKESTELNQAELPDFLLKKYLGSEKTLEPIAYYANPNPESEDFELHTVFLQPFRLYGILPEYRKFKGESRQWLWTRDILNSNSAPIFRRIIQLYIANEFKSDDLVLKETLLTSLQTEINALFYALTNEPNLNSVVSNSRGLLSDPDLIAILDNRLLPGFLDVASLYPLGRLLFGQTSEEVHHTIANRQQPGWFGYALAFLISHLNLSTSTFWVKVGLRILLNQWQTFKDYVSGRPNELMLQSFLFIPNAFILAASPLLILIPALYGITALPFTLLHRFCLEGPFKFLKNLNFLIALDILGLIKDCAFFFYFAIPVLSFLLASINAIVPPLLIGAGYYTSFILVLLVLGGLFNIVFGDTSNDALNRLISSIAWGIAGTNFFLFLGINIFLGIGAYLGTSLLAKLVVNTLPSNVLEKIKALFTPLSNLVLKIELGLTRWLGIKISHEIEAIIPLAEAQPNLLPPKIVPKMVLTSEDQDKINSLILRLGKLNQSHNLTPEQKRSIKTCIENLEITKHDNRESLTLAEKQAQLILQDNFSVEEANIMKGLVSELQEMNKEKAALQVQGAQNSYQPSWQLIQLLRDKELTQKLTPDMQAKCEHIWQLKPI